MDTSIREDVIIQPCMHCLCVRLYKGGNQNVRLVIRVCNLTVPADLIQSGHQPESECEREC